MVRRPRSRAGLCREIAKCPSCRRSARSRPTSPSQTLLIDQLGMSYGMSNDLAKSKFVLEYGISIDPDYPMFYYNIACGYGEQNDKANALQFLKKAFDRKTNLNSSEKMPDPLTDGSFKKFVSDM